MPGGPLLLGQRRRRSLQLLLQPIDLGASVPRAAPSSARTSSAPRPAPAGLHWSRSRPGSGQSAQSSRDRRWERRGRAEPGAPQLRAGRRRRLGRLGHRRRRLCACGQGETRDKRGEKNKLAIHVVCRAPWKFSLKPWDPPACDCAPSGSVALHPPSGRRSCATEEGSHRALPPLYVHRPTFRRCELAGARGLLELPRLYCPAPRRVKPLLPKCGALPPGISCFL